jgi:hypothetical protein
MQPSQRDFVSATDFLTDAMAAVLAAPPRATGSDLILTMKHFALGQKPVGFLKMLTRLRHGTLRVPSLYDGHRYWVDKSVSKVTLTAGR